jgi:hypothetical protein
MSGTISFNLETYQSFKKEYQNAVNGNKTQFKFQNNDFLTSYAKYLLEYLKCKFE